MKSLTINKKISLTILIIFGIVVGTMISGSIFRDNIVNSMYENDDIIDINLADNLRKGNSLTVNFAPTRFGGYSPNYIMENIPNLPREEPSKGPTYYLLLASYYYIFDVEQKDLYLYGSIFNNLILSIFAILYFFIIKRTFNIKIATISSIMIISLPYFSWAASSVSNESLLYVFFISGLYFLKKKTSHYFIFGILAGLAHLTHPLGILMALSYPIYLLLTKQFKGALIVVSSWHLILIPLFVRNYALFSDIGRGLQLPYSSAITDIITNNVGPYASSSLGEISPNLNSLYFLSPISLVERMMNTEMNIMALLLVFILLLTPFAFLNLTKIRTKLLFLLPIVITMIYLSIHYLGSTFHLVTIIVIPSIIILVLIFRTQIFQTNTHLSYFVLFSFLNFIFVYTLPILKPWFFAPGLRFVFLSVILLLPISIYSCYRLYNQFCPNIKKIYGQATIPLILVLLFAPIILNYDVQLNAWKYDTEKVQEAQEMNNWIRQNMPQQTVIMSNSEERAWLGTGHTSVTIPAATLTLDVIRDFDKLIKYYNTTHIVFYETSLLRPYLNNFSQEKIINSITSFPTPNFHFEKIYGDNSFILKIIPNTDEFWNTEIYNKMNDHEYENALRGLKYYEIFMQLDSKSIDTEESKNNIVSSNSNLEDLKEKIIYSITVDYEKQIDYKLNLILDLPKDENLKAIQIYDDMIQLTNQKITLFENNEIYTSEKDFREKIPLLIDQQKQFHFKIINQQKQLHLKIIDQSIEDGNLEKAFETYNLFIKKFLTDSVYEETSLTMDEQNDVMEKIAIISMKTGDLSDTETAYLQIIGNDRFNPQAWKMYAIILEQQNKYEQALPAFEMAIKLNPNDDEITEKYELLKKELDK